MPALASRKAGRNACGNSCVRPKPEVMKVLIMIIFLQEFAYEKK